MTPRPTYRLAIVMLAYAWGAAGLALAVGTSALAGWTLGIEPLKRLNLPDGAALNPMTAVGFILAGLALALAIRKRPFDALSKQTSLGCAIVLVLIGIFHFLSMRFAIPLDHLLFPSRTTNTPMAPNTAGGFIALGTALLLMDCPGKRGYHPETFSALVTAAAAMLALTGYVQGVVWFYQMGSYIPMALSTAIIFLLLGTAILAARPELEPMATLLSPTAGGTVARRLLPAAAGLPLLIGWLCLLGSERLYQRAFSLTLFSLLMTLIFLMLIWWNARFLLRLDVERQQAEHRAEEERHLLRSLIDNLPDMVYVKDTEHRFLLNNLAHAGTLGATGPEEMLGKSDRDFFPPQLSAQMRAEEREVVRSGTPMIDKEERVPDITGATRSLLVTKVPLRDTAGRIIGIVGISHDISKRKRAEEERDKFFTLSADMMCIASFDGYFLRVNPAWETTLGYTAEELTSRPWIEWVHPDDVPATMAEAKKLTLGAVTLFFENRYRAKDGTYRWLSWTVVPVVVDQRLYGVARDMTERRAAEEKLRETNQRLAEVLESELEAQNALRAAQSTMVQTEKLAGLGQMVAGVAHEINNPLSFVSNNVAVLQRDLRGILKLLDLYGQAEGAIEQTRPELMEQIRQVGKEMDFGYTLANLQQLLERSREGLRRIYQIVKDLRDFARLDEADLSEVNLNDGIQSTVNIITGHAKKRGIAIRTELAPLPKVRCYPAKINQVVMNLLTNAIDASRDNGEVAIRTRPGDDSNTVIIEVTDTGSGIDPAIRDRIFDPFFTTKPPGQGTGLGLSISYGIVRDHAGSIEVRSAVGKGSTFTVTLPLAGPARNAEKAGALCTEQT